MEPDPNQMINTPSPQNRLGAIDVMKAGTKAVTKEAHLNQSY